MTKIKFSLFLWVLLPLLNVYGENTKKQLEDAHESLSKVINSTVNSIDQFFNDSRFNEGDSTKNRTQVRFGAKTEQGGNSSLIASVRIQASFPNLSEKFQLLIDGSSDELLVEEEKVVGASLQDQIDFVGAAIRYNIYENEEIKINFDTGSKFTIEPKFYSLLRFRNQYKLTDDIIFRPTQTLFYDETESGWGELTRLDLDWIVNNNKLLRSRSEARYTEVSNGFEINQEFRLRHKISEEKGVGARLNLLAETDPSVVMTEYRTGLFYRQRLNWDWLNIETEPFLRFPRDQDYDSVAGILLFFEIVFEKT